MKKNMKWRAMYFNFFYFPQKWVAKRENERTKAILMWFITRSSKKFVFKKSFIITEGNKQRKRRKNPTVVIKNKKFILKVKRRKNKERREKCVIGEARKGKFVWDEYLKA